MFRIISWIAVAILLAMQSNAQDKNLIAAIKQYGNQLSTAKPDTANTDLVFLKEVLSGKAVIALGESTHGTKEMFTMKHRVVKYLVEEMNYRVFAIEANFSECLAINDYVMYGKGDPELALRGIYFWTWNTVEVLDMIQWMREYNKDKPDTGKVKFLGFDMQYAMGAAKAVKASLDELDIDYHEYKALLDSMAVNKGYVSFADSARQHSFLVQVQKLYDYALTYEDVYVRNKSGKEYMLHMQHINILLQAITNHVSSDGYRDSCMAANIKWIAEYEKADRIVLWAHNAHISKSRMSEQMSYNMMGYWLHNIYGNKYYAIGFDFNIGNFRSKEAWFISESTKMSYRMKEFSITKTRKHTSNYIFAQAGMPIMYIDYATASASPEINDFLSGAIKTKLIGAAYWPDKENAYYFTVKLKEAFDATIFLNKTTASVPIASYTKYVEKLKKIND